LELIPAADEPGGEATEVPAAAAGVEDHVLAKRYDDVCGKAYDSAHGIPTAISTA
jgi:hypothetical protein